MEKIRSGSRSTFVTKQTNSLVESFNMNKDSVHVTKVNRSRSVTCPKPSRNSAIQVKRLTRVKQVQPDKFQNVSSNNINLKHTQSGVRIYRAKRTSVHPGNPNESSQRPSANQDIASQAMTDDKTLISAENPSLREANRDTLKHIIPKYWHSTRFVKGNTEEDKEKKRRRRREVDFITPNCYCCLIIATIGAVVIATVASVVALQLTQNKSVNGGKILLTGTSTTVTSATSTTATTTTTEITTSSVSATSASTITLTSTETTSTTTTSSSSTTSTSTTSTTTTSTTTTSSTTSTTSTEIITTTITIGTATTTTSTTTTTAVPPNLLTNPGAESGLTGWTQIGTSNAIVDTGGIINSGYNPRTGSGMFAGGKSASTALASLSQTVNILGGIQNYSADQLDAGSLRVEIKFWYQNYYQWLLSTDSAQVIVTFLSATSTVLGTVDSGQKSCGSGPGWCQYSITVSLPVGTRSIQYVMIFIRKGGSDNDAYIDDNSLRII